MPFEIQTCLKQLESKDVSIQKSALQQLNVQLYQISSSNQDLHLILQDLLYKENLVRFFQDLKYECVDIYLYQIAICPQRVSRRMYQNVGAFVSRRSNASFQMDLWSFGMLCPTIECII